MAEQEGFSGAVYLSMLQSHMDEETIKDSIKAIYTVLKQRLRVAKHERKKDIEGAYFVDEVEDQLAKLQDLAEILDVDLE